MATEEDIAFVLSLDKSELDSLPYNVLKWPCCCKECSGFTKVRDYGIKPFFFLNRNSQGTLRNPAKYWMNTDKTVWLCGKHYKIEKEKGSDYVFLFHFEKNKLPEESIKEVNQGIQKITK